MPKFPATTRPEKSRAMRLACWCPAASTCLWFHVSAVAKPQGPGGALFDTEGVFWGAGLWFPEDPAMLLSPWTGRGESQGWSPFQVILVGPSAGLTWGRSGCHVRGGQPHTPILGRR